MPAFEWDPMKALANRTIHGVSFELAEKFEFETALTAEDDRFDYGEQRWRSLGLIDNRHYVLVFTMRGSAVRIISLRKANSREVREYEKS